MDQVVIGVILLASLFVLLGLGVWIAAALLGVGWIAMVLLGNAPVGKVLATTLWGAGASWSLAALPLFIWMGEILFRTRLSEMMFRGLSPWLGWLPGRLMHVNVVGCGIFAAVSGSSAATAATIGKMAYPELIRRGYSERMAIGSLAGSGTLGLLIPPSIIMIVYGVAAEVSITRLFIAGVVPGLLLASLFSGYIVLWALLNPKGTPPKEKGLPLLQRFAALGELIPVISLIALVIWSIYSGVATATEAAAFGVMGALGISWWLGALNWSTFTDSVMGATRMSCMIAFILAGAAFLTAAMGFVGIPRSLAAWIGSLDLGPYHFVVAVMILYIVLGCFLDGISMIVLTTSVLLPLVQEVGFDLIWFGIFIILVVEMGQITPPVGFNLFVLQSLSGRGIGAVALASFPFFLVMVLTVTLITVFPEIVTYLPSQMMGR